MLVILDDLLQKSPVTPIDLIHFKVMHPPVVEEMFNKGKEGKQESKEEEENEAKEGGSSVGR